MRIGVDVGAVRVGVARSDPSGVLATPVATLARGGPDVLDGDDMTALAGIVRESQAVEVVVGLPRSLSGEEGAAAGHARSYAAALARAVTPVPVRLVDERLTTVAAHRNLHDSGRPGRRHREVVDQAAAVLILQTALDQERAGGVAPGDVVPTRKPRHKGPQG
ncbi:putative Holliday junction resolvase [Mobilicoccus pelagius NBRC 104925]|uniref:Putative pre-16S rRNA nuclease n=1 Tax=Mobilicoccus pelagius NBRC 104925 TaxID=1089455 RepID=H5UV44_9MICO|nr:putative Holliday junction resolvase [Mobilicoccus pelagius NBRC 104925]